ncbi:MAG: asparagine synthase [Bacteroidetes bacterium]|nr:asparagine synthase [Bacteroidota bacterium]
MNHFFGYVSLHNEHIDLNRNYRMQRSMDIFPYDAEGVYEEKNIFICDRIKYNTAESYSTPLMCENNRYVLAASTRLDNREELAKKFAIDVNKSDHECVLEMFTRFGSDSLQYLVGDFSFVVWDKQEKHFFLAKDHIGVKPLFYYQDQDIFIFSTNINAIKAALTKRLPINIVYVAKELKPSNQNHEDTFFDGILRVMPAHFVQYKPTTGQLEEVRYWELKEIDISRYTVSEAAIYEELGLRYEEAVRCRAKTNRSVGCQLSGGLDSSSIAVLLSRMVNPEKIHTFSFVLSDKTRGFSENGIDEQGTQNEILDYSGLLRDNHHKIEEFPYKDVFEQFEVSNKVLGGYTNTDCIWQDPLFKKAKEYNVGVLMSGFPGDECVSDSSLLYHYEFIGNKDVRRIWNFIKEFRWVALRKIVGYYLSQRRGTFIRGFMKTLKMRNVLRKDSVYQHMDWDYYSKITTTYKEFLKSKIGGTHPCLRMESEGMYAAQYGIETVYPLADIRLVEFIYSLPIETFKPKPYSRVIFRNMCKGILPDSVRLQPKFNGAKTLAFADYWIYTNLNDLKEYEIEDQLEMFELKEEVMNSTTLDLHLRKLLLYTLDYFINRYKDTEVNAS